MAEMKPEEKTLTRHHNRTSEMQVESPSAVLYFARNYAQQQQEGPKP
jgi:hypothetical protein